MVKDAPQSCHHGEAVSAMLAVFKPPAKYFSRCGSSVVKDTHTHFGHLEGSKVEPDQHHVQKSCKNLALL